LQRKISMKGKLNGVLKIDLFSSFFCEERYFLDFEEIFFCTVFNRKYFEIDILYLHILFTKHDPESIRNLDSTKFLNPNNRFIDPMKTNENLSFNPMSPLKKFISASS